MLQWPRTMAIASAAEKGCGRDEVAGVEAAAILEFRARTDLDDRGHAGEAELAGKAALAGEPIDVKGNGDGALFDPAVSLVEAGGDGGALQSAADGKAFQRDGNGQPFGMGQNGRDLFGFVLDRLLAENQTAGRGKSRDKVQRYLSGGPVVAAPRGLAVDGDKLGPAGPSLANPGHEAGRKQIRIDPVHQ